MAQALLSSFDEWVRSLLNALQSNGADMSDFVEYLTGIISSESETDEEKQQAIAELLADLDLKVIPSETYLRLRNAFGRLRSTITTLMLSATRFSIAGIH